MTPRPRFQRCCPVAPHLPATLWGAGALGIPYGQYGRSIGLVRAMFMTSPHSLVAGRRVNGSPAVSVCAYNLVVAIVWLFFLYIMYVV